MLWYTTPDVNIIRVLMVTPQCTFKPVVITLYTPAWGKLVWCACGGLGSKHEATLPEEQPHSCLLQILTVLH